MLYVLAVGMLIVLLFSMLYLFMLMPRMTQRRRMRAFLGMKWAHRGLHCREMGIPENSMAAFREAIKEGVGIELDVHLTKDKQLVVFHDDTLKRICGREGRIEEQNLVELEKCYLSGTSEKIPLFSDVLQYVNGRVPLLIEVKLPTKNTEICEYLDAELRGYTGEYLVQSFNCLVLRWMKQHHPSVLRGQLSSNLVKSDRTPHYLLRFVVTHLLTDWFCRPDFISYKLEDRHNLGLWLVQHLFGAPVAMWTLKNETSMRIAEMGCDMYIFEREK